MSDDRTTKQTPAGAMDDSNFEENEIVDFSGEDLADDGIPNDIDVKTKSLHFINCRLHKIENIQRLIHLRNLSLRKNLIEKLENLDALIELRALDAYDNKITRLEGLQHNNKLTYLDLSFNVIEEIENISHLTELEELYLIENRIAALPDAAQFAEKLQKLRVLELGGNRLRSLDKLNLAALTQLWIGKNKIRSLAEVQLPNLKLLSMQSNRVTSWAVFPSFEHLEELYLSHNGIESFIDFPESLTKTLRILDVGTNRIADISSLPRFEQLEEFWFNNNQIATFEELNIIQQQCGHCLSCIYAEGNPFASHAQYRPKMAMQFPNVDELDSTPLVKPSWAATQSSAQ